jgi:electron transfer flavoprotein beta subunit
MEICVCVKRVPMVGGAIMVTPDGLEVDTAMSGFTVSPHEECALEEAVQITERLGGSVTVLTLGPPSAADQLREMLALGASRAVLLQTGGPGSSGPESTGPESSGPESSGPESSGPESSGPESSGPESSGTESSGPESSGPESSGTESSGTEWGPIATAAAIAAAVRDAGGYDLLLFGNEAADTGGYQVPVRVAHALGLPCATGIKRLEIGPDSGGGHRAVASREYRGAQESFDLPLPAVISVKEGINLPRYPSLPGRLRAKRASIETSEPAKQPDGLRKERLRVPAGSSSRSQVLGFGPDAVPALVQVLDELGVLP